MNFPITQIVVIALLVGGGLLYRRWMMQRMRGQTAGPAAREAMVRFFETTGYKDRALPGGDAGAQADAYLHRLNEVYASMGPNGTAARFEVEWIREMDGTTIWYRTSWGGGQGTTGAWTVPLARAPRLRWRAVSLAGGGGAVDAGDLGMPTVRPADPDLARHVRINAAGDEAAVQAMLAAPGLKEALLSCAYVDLQVGAEVATFDDPGSRNVYAAVGGYFGAMLSAGNVMKTFEVSAPVHDNIADLMVRAIQASG